MFARNDRQLDNLRRSVSTVRRLSDGVVGIGRFRIGLDTVLAAVPWAGLAYSLGAGGLLMAQGVRARASPGVLGRMALYLVADSLIDVPVPLLPAVIDAFFTGHTWAADVLLKHMDETIYYEGTRAAAEADPEFRARLEAMAQERRATGKAKMKRIVYLG